MKRFLTTAATALVLGTSGYADEPMTPFADMTFDQATNLNASELIGMFVYATESDTNNQMTVAADGEKEWDNIGDINEIVLTRDGNVQSVIVGVGGFLGMSEKDVAINMDQLKFVSDGEAAGEFFLVINASVAGIEEAPSYTAPMMRDEAMADDMRETRTMLTTPNIERAGYSSVKAEDLTTEDLTGARVYGASDEDIGEIGELLLSDSGKLERAVIDVGGFLGMGEHHVAVTMEELQIVRADEGNSLRVYIDSSKEALEKQPEYNS